MACRMSIMICLVMVLAVLFSDIPVGAVPIVLENVPAYNWYHGCGPTAAGSIIGYWDLHGYPNLFDASGWANVSLTSNVKDQISSPEHNTRYDPTPDDKTKPQSWNSIADWFHASEDPLGYGGSYLMYADDAFMGYANYRGYSFLSGYGAYGINFTWIDIVYEIDNGLPLMFLVDSSGDGVTDHFVPVLGYDDRGVSGLWYGCYTTWSESESVSWYQFREMSSSYTWGVGYATFVYPLSEPTLDPIPEPSTILLLTTGLGSIAFGIRKKHKARR